MQIKTLRAIIDLVILLIIVNYILNILGEITAAIGGAIVSIIYLIFYRLAAKMVEGKKVLYYLLMWVPTILFIVLPILYDLSGDSSLSLWSVIFSLPWLSLLIPSLLLYIVREELSKKI